MANKHRGEVSINLDKERTLRLTTNSAVELEKELGFSVTKINENTIGFTVIRAIIWAALRSDNKDLTIEEVGNLMDHGDFNDVATKAMEAFKLVFQKGSTQTGKS